ncbi:aspartate aminotransferase family protein [Actinoplanes cyaneus]|uniref:Aspartate aminotransferase family protein n=1 Tax=Actinoplanes cyaneus TaxID=52696 RepID=A0A919IS95_9ACTN|nr:aspartate aminotransferase family protein [Actinoplanes cyaneus]MCW2138202.1 putrescine aminotransferase [Actinoplanes cyaneus]GID70503.1 aspartate aminotransferase family protein [Actinoplanes cyaneus]
MSVVNDLPFTARTAAELAEIDRRVLVHPHNHGSQSERITIVRGQGCTVWDAHGVELLDVMGAGNWVAQVGHGRPELADAAARQIRTLEYYTGFDIFANDQSITLAQRLVDLAPDGLDRVFFTNGGSESVETAFKFARLYHHHRGEPDRTWFISRNFAYHGSTFASGTATGFPGIHEGIGPEFPNVARVSTPHPYRAPDISPGRDLTDFLIEELAATIERIGPGNVAAMIGEPVMGGAGILVPPADYWPRVRELLSRHGILLIADEVVTGYGRTGAWYDSADRGMQADLVTVAKGLTSGYAPLGAVLMSDAVAGTITGGDTYLFHGHTYSGHATACAIAHANLDLLEQEKLVDRARTVGEWLHETLAPLAGLPLVGEVRVAGATVGVELVADRETREPLMADWVTRALREKHRVAAREYGNTLVMAPPLIISRAEVERAAEALTDVLRAGAGS